MVTDDISKTFLTETVECWEMILIPWENTLLAEMRGKKEDLSYCKKSRICWHSRLVNGNVKNVCEILN